MFNRFRLNVKFTIILTAIFVIGMFLSFLILTWFLTQRAEQEVTVRGLVLLESMTSVRDFVSTSINPMITNELDQEDFFAPQIIPAYAAREVFEDFRQEDEHYRAFEYKEATLNPMNQRNRADAFEQNIIQQFRNDPDLEELSGFRTLNGRQVFYIARPMTVDSESCLRCHGEATDAPTQLIAVYGDQHGFGWQVGETISSQMIYVPADEVYDTAQRSVLIMMGIFTVIFLIAIVLINLSLRRSVITPVGKITIVAEKVTSGDVVVEELQTETLEHFIERHDELGQLSRIFRRMAEEVIKREQDLKKQIKKLIIEIDETKKEQQVQQIVESDYFADLKARAEKMRGRSGDQQS